MNAPLVLERHLVVFISNIIVEPDIAMFGKATRKWLWEYMPVIGKSEICNGKRLNNTFISSTFWTERIGPTAGLGNART